MPAFAQPTDADLLQAYAAERSQVAFTELVQRHLNLVYSVALRQVGGDRHLAQDVAQKVFADLARKAPELAARAVISGWLYRGAKFAATDLVRAEQRRRQRENLTVIMNEIHENPPAGVTEWEQARPVLDEALAELPEPDRDAVALRFFENRSFPEIGAALRVTEEAARKRVDRAVEKMHGLLVRRGIQSSVAALSTVLASQVAVAAPAGLGAAIAGEVLTGVGAGGAAFTFMSLTKLQMGITAAIVAAAAGGISWYYQAGSPARNPEPAHAEIVTASATAQPSPETTSTSTVSPPVNASAPVAEPAKTAKGGGKLPAATATETAQQVQERRMIIRRYGALFDKLNLTPDQRERLIRMLIDDREASVDYAAANASVGVDATRDPDDFKVTVYQERQEIQAQMRALLGDDLYDQFVAGDVEVRQAAVVERLQKNLKNTDARLSAAQATQLQGLMQQLGAYYVTDDLLAGAGAFLSASQLEALNTLKVHRDAGAQKDKVQAAVKKNLP